MTESDFLDVASGKIRDLRRELSTIAREVQPADDPKDFDTKTRQMIRDLMEHEKGMLDRRARILARIRPLPETA